MKARAREDQLIVSYLLGLSSEIEQNQIESRYFKDQRFYEQVLTVEEELICDYISQDLNDAERHHFESYFLKSAHRRQKYDSTRKLMAYLADQGDWHKVPVRMLKLSAKNITKPTRLIDWLSGLLSPKLSLGWMVVATVLLLLCGVGLTRHIASLRLEMQQTETAQLVLEQQAQQLRGTAARQRAETAAKHNEAASLTELVSSGAKNLSASLGGNEQVTLNIAKLSLTTMRSSTASPAEIRLPRNTQAIQVSLQLDHRIGTLTRYRIKLSDIEQESRTWHWEAAAHNQQLLIEIPTEYLHTGVYSLTATGMTPDHQYEFAGETFVRIVRE